MEELAMDTAVRWQADVAAPIRDVSPATAADAIIEDHADLPVLKPGAELEAGGVYLDLAHPVRGPFCALVGQVTGSGNRYVAQRDVPCDVWCQLVKSLAAIASEDWHEGERSEADHPGGVPSWPTPQTVQPQDMAAP
jgi:hypothetical protein